MNWRLITLQYCSAFAVHWHASAIVQSFLKNIHFYLFIWLHWVSVVACRIIHCGMWDLIPRPGIKLGPPALGVWSLTGSLGRSLLFFFIAEWFHCVDRPYFTYPLILQWMSCFQCLAVTNNAAVLASCQCPYKVQWPQAWWLEQQDFLPSQIWRPDVENQGVGRRCSF